MAELLLFLIFALFFTLASPKDFALTILHTNDVHAHFLSFNDRQQPCTEKDINSSTCWGGAARRQTALKRFAAADENVLKLDAGDQYQGTIWYTALKWEPIAKYLNLMKYDAMTFGNHEFDDGVQGLEPFVRNLTTPIVVSNINDKGSKLNGLFKKDLVKVVGGEKIGKFFSLWPCLSNMCEDLYRFRDHWLHHRGYPQPISSRPRFGIPGRNPILTTGGRRAHRSGDYENCCSEPCWHQRG